MEANQILLDFLYADHERVASFLAQLHGLGTPKETQQSASKAKSTGQKGGLQLGVASGGGTNEREWGQEVRQTYDPLWSNSRKLIDEIQDRKTSSHAIHSIGQIRI